MTDQEKLDNAIKIVNSIEDETLKHRVVICLELLGTGDLKRDFDRAARSAFAVMHEWHKEVSEPLVLAIAINLTLGALMTGQEDAQRVYERTVDMLLNDRPLFEAVVHLASYAEILAPACKREAQFIQEQLGDLRKRAADALANPELKNRS